MRVQCLRHHRVIADHRRQFDHAAHAPADQYRRLNSAEVKEKRALQGATTVGGTGEQFAALVKTEMEKWAQVGKAAGVKLQ